MPERQSPQPRRSRSIFARMGSVSSDAPLPPRPGMVSPETIEAVACGFVLPRDRALSRGPLLKPSTALCYTSRPHKNTGTFPPERLDRHPFNRRYSAARSDQHPYVLSGSRNIGRSWIKCTLERLRTRRRHAPRLESDQSAPEFLNYATRQESDKERSTEKPDNLIRVLTNSPHGV